MSAPLEVDSVLSQFGFTVGELLEVADAAHSAKVGMTDNDPLNAGGLMAWIHGTRRLREIGISKGYERDNTGGVPSVYNTKLGIRLTVCNADANTGNPDSKVEPRNNSDKGTSAESMVAANVIFSKEMSELLEEARGITPINSSISVGGAPSGLVTWYLLVHSSGEDFRAELSCPTDFNNGFFSNYSHRIILRGLSTLGTDPLVTQKDSSEPDNVVEIEIFRKKS